jgi:hypothetical protein
VENQVQRYAVPPDRAPPQDAARDAPHFRHTEIAGRFDQYRSSYWGGAIAALGLRYGLRPFFRKSSQANPEDTSVNYSQRYRFGAVTGLIMYGISSIYAWKTYKDVRNVFAEAVAAETGKKADDVNLIDLWKSKNSIVKRTMGNFFKYNLRRFGVNTVFFTPFIPLAGKALFNSDFFKRHKLQYGDTPVEWGVAANSGYLVSDIFTRKITFFEELQNLIDHKINHTDRSGEMITANDLISLYDRDEREVKGRAATNIMSTPAWPRMQALFGRMADLMNQTYGNKPNTEGANLTVPTLIYLFGHELIRAGAPERNAAYVEIANRYGIEGAKRASAMVAKGIKLDDVLAKFPVVTQADREMGKAMGIDFDTQAPQKTYTAAAPKRENMAATLPLASHREKVESRESNGLAVPGIA